MGKAMPKGPMQSAKASATRSSNRRRNAPPSRHGVISRSMATMGNATTALAWRFAHRMTSGTAQKTRLSSQSRIHNNAAKPDGNPTREHTGARRRSAGDEEQRQCDADPD